MPTPHGDNRSLNSDQDRPGAVILGGTFACMAAARNLADQGVRVCIVGAANSLARYSRAASLFVKWPALTSFDQVPGFLAQLAGDKGLQGWVLFPCDDEQLRAVSQQSALLEQHYLLTTPSWQTLRLFYDKRATLALAREAGVPCPQTCTVEHSAQLADLDLRFPAVLKPAISTHFSRTSSTKAFRVDNRPELERVHERMSQAIGAPEVLIQALLPGPEKNLFSFAGFFVDGEPVSGLSAKRTRQFPRDFGRISTFVEAEELPELRELSRRLLRAARYTGLAEVEFMWNEAAERFELLEVNARLWAWHGLAIAAGLDLPYMAYAQATGKHAPAAEPRYDMKWIRLRHDWRVAAQDIRSGRLSVRQYLASLRGPKSFAVFSPSDPLPFIVEPFLSWAAHGKAAILKKRRQIMACFAKGTKSM